MKCDWLTYINFYTFSNISSAACMLKVQHMPISVGNVLKMAEQGIALLRQ